MISKDNESRCNVRDVGMGAAIYVPLLRYAASVREDTGRTTNHIRIQIVYSQGANWIFFEEGTPEGGSRDFCIFW
jgi:hypothetical protein